MQATPATGSPAAGVRFAVLGEAVSSDSAPPQALVANGVITIRGTTRRPAGGGVYADVDLSQAGTIRLTLYDSVPGRPIEAPLPSGVGFRRVRYEASVGPLPPGPYEVIVGWFDPRARLVRVSQPPLKVEVGRAGGR